MATTLLLSGGIDSLVVLDLLNEKEVVPDLLFVNYGQASLRFEALASNNIAAHFGLPLKTVEIRLVQHFAAGEIAHRNGALVFIAAMVGGKWLDAIAIGIHAGSPYADCSPGFIELLNSALLFSGDGRPQLLAPLRTWNKPEILAYAKKRQLPISLTYSCEAGSMPPCGRCLSCLDRKSL
jgi:7-cyano-7-deazaguanine synthase